MPAGPWNGLVIRIWEDLRDSYPPRHYPGHYPDPDNGLFYSGVAWNEQAADT